jgi:hypothetical protein
MKLDMTLEVIIHVGWRRVEMCTEFLWGNIFKSVHLGDIEDGNITIRWTLGRRVLLVGGRYWFRITSSNKPYHYKC